MAASKRHRTGVQVQTQCGPGVQEIGGFCPSAVMALVNSAAVARGVGGAAKAPRTSGRYDDRATVWQAWQDWHGSQCSSWVSCTSADGMARFEVCPLQSGCMCLTEVAAVCAAFACPKWALGPVLWALSATVFVVPTVAAALWMAMSVAMASPIQPRRGSRKIMKARTKRRIG